MWCLDQRKDIRDKGCFNSSKKTHALVSRLFVDDKVDYKVGQRH